MLRNEMGVQMRRHETVRGIPGKREHHRERIDWLKVKKDENAMEAHR